MERFFLALNMAIWAHNGIKVAVYAFISDWANFTMSAGWMLLFALFVQQKRQVD